MPSTAAQLDLFRTVAPEFGPGEPAEKSDAEVSAVLDVVVDYIYGEEVQTLGVMHDLIVVRRAAHEMTMQQRELNAAGQGAATTALTSERAGLVAVSYGQPSATRPSEWYDLTAHGKALKALLRSRPHLKMFTTSRLYDDNMWWTR